MIDSKIFGITRLQFEALRTSIAPITIDGDSGKISYEGVEGNFSFDEAKSQLRIEITQKPRLVPMHFVWANICHAIADVGGS